MAREIVVSGGAGFWCGREGLALDRYVLALTGKLRPRVCYLATAAGDSAEFIQGFYDHIGPLAEATHLPLFLPPFRDPAETLLAQDVIYVSGGSTSNMLAVWRLHGIDQLLLRAVDSGTILYGSSAGGLCWFDAGISDSLGFDGALRPLTNGLGLLAGSHSPHFDDGERRSRFEALIRDELLPAGVGIDEFAAAHYIDGQLCSTVSSVGTATAHIVRRQADGAVSTQPLTALSVS